MSFKYYVNEYLNTKNDEACPGLAETIRWQFSKLCTIMLYDNAIISNMTLTADGKDYSFSSEKDEMNAFKALLGALDKASEITFSADYEYCNYNDYDIRPDTTCNYIDAMIEQGECNLSDFFYAAHIIVDYEPGLGDIYAYGERNGKQYRGLVELTDADKLPDDGHWNAADTLIFYESEPLMPADKDAVIASCRAFDSMNGYYSLEIEENSVSFHLNDINEISSKKDFEEFISLYLDLLRATHNKGEVIANFQFFDFYGNDIPSLLKFDVDADGLCTVKMAVV